MITTYSKQLYNQIRREQDLESLLHVSLGKSRKSLAFQETGK